MPNTLAHLGVQALVTRTLLPRAELRWIALGCVIPDLPWIAQRALRTLFDGVYFDSLGNRASVFADPVGWCATFVAIGVYLPRFAHASPHGGG